MYGLFGMLFFVTQLHWGYSLISGAFTLAIMVLPVIMRTTEEALIAVPDSYREGSFGLGAGKLRTVFTIVLPSAMPGILSGVILATGRIVGETAALIYTASSMPQIPRASSALPARWPCICTCSPTRACYINGPTAPPWCCWYWCWPSTACRLYRRQAGRKSTRKAPLCEGLPAIGWGRDIQFNCRLSLGSLPQSPAATAPPQRELFRTRGGYL